MLLDGNAVVRGNRVYNNTKAGLLVQGGSALIRKNMIYSSDSQGCHISGNATPRLERNDFFFNKGSALLVDNGADPLVRKNLVRDGKSDGVVVGLQGLGLFEGNRIFMNANIGFKVHRGGCPIVRDNQINNGNGSGLCLEPGAMGEFTDNLIAANYGDQIRVEGNDQGGDNPNLTFTNNEINWKNQPSFRLPEFVPIIRAQGSKAFVEQREEEEEETVYRDGEWRKEAPSVFSSLPQVSGGVYFCSYIFFCSFFCFFLFSRPCRESLGGCAFSKVVAVVALCSKATRALTFENVCQHAEPPPRPRSRG